MGSYLRLLAAQLRVSFALAAAYRLDFFLEAALSAVWMAIGIVPLAVAFRARADVGGWTFDRALVVVGFFVIVKGLLEGAVSPSLVAVVEHIRAGTLDFVLIKPKDAQFLVSTTRFEVFRALNVAVGVGIFAWAFRSLGRAPSLADVLLSLVMLLAAVAVVYSLWILVVALAFWVVRLDNLAYLLSALLDFARWPISMFKGAWAFVFTFVLPLALMTTYPAEALLGVLSLRTAASALVGAAALFGVSRVIWLRSLGHYTSASS